MNIPGNTFLVSGGGSGLGAACVRMLASAGANLVIADVNRETGQKLAEDIGSKARFVATDVTSEDDVQNAVNTAVATFGSLQGAVTCAGIAVAERVLGK